MTDLKHERHCKFAGEYSDIIIYLKLRKDVDAFITPKYVLHHEKRDDSDSPWTPIKIDYEVIKTCTYNTDIHYVMTYNPDDVIKADGKLKQNYSY